MPKLVIINVTDDSIGVENKPDDLTVEVRDYRGDAQARGADSVQYQDGRPYFRHRFEAEL